MRMRKKKHGAERLEAQKEYLVSLPETPITSPLTHFHHDGPMCLEIGCGKGGFACGMAALHPEINLYAFEKVPDVMVIAVEQAKEREEERDRDNLRFMIGDAKDLPLWFGPGSLDAIYLNFSDPWHKKRHAKRRLTYRTLLETYRTLLKDGGTLYFKTDNRPLFDFTLEELEAVNLSPDYVTYDLHNSPWNRGNVMTEYEKNFTEKGFPINALAVTVHTPLTPKAGQ